MKRAIIQNLVAYSVAGSIIWFLARGIPLGELAVSLRHANLWLFVPACLLSFLFWFLGETLLFARLFSYFHAPTKFRELIAANAAQYFLQLINMLVAGTALVLFVHQRKRVPWLAAGFTLTFQAFVDGFILASLTIIASLLVPSSRIVAGLPWALGFVAIWFAIVAFWMVGKPQLRLGKWLMSRPSLVCFREARPRTYLGLMAIRTPIFVSQSLTLYLQLLSFHINVPFIQVLGFTPAVLAMGGLPITPVGIGPLQAVLMHGFKDFASRPELLTMALSVSMMNIIFRIPLGLGSAGAFAREVSEASRSMAPRGAAPEPAPTELAADGPLEALGEIPATQRASAES